MSSFPETSSFSYEYPQTPSSSTDISGWVPPPPTFTRKVGRMYVLLERKDSNQNPKFVCVVGPCWPMVFGTSAMILGISLFVILKFMHDIQTGLLIAALIALAATMVTFCLTACSNPGIQARYDTPQGENWTWNETAKTYRPPGAVYDSEAQVIVQDIDHFCPWTGTIIAKANMRYFNSFVTSLCILLILVLVCLGSGMMPANIPGGD